MDNTGNKPRRPSLFNTGPANAPAPPPVATIDSVDKAVATDASGSKRGPVLWIGAIAVVAIVGASAFVLLRAPPSPETDMHAVATAAQPASTENAGSAAVLLPDDPASTDNPLARLSAARQPAVEPLPGIGSVATDASPTPAVDTVAATEAMPVRAASAEQARRTATRRPAPQAASDAAASTELMRTLLGHINGSEPQRLVASNSPRSLDDLIQDLLDRDANGNALDTGSPELQEALRKCPAANSVSGIACRQQVCSSHAGRDPACPRQ